MLKSRMRWVVVLLVLFLITLACSKKEEETGPEGTRQETPAEQKNAITGQSQEQPQAKSAGQEEEPKTMPAESTTTEEKSETGATASGGQGKEIYQQTCSSCHETGVAGAPKIGDTEAWSSRVAKGEDLMVQNAVNGIGTMPPKGGDPTLSEEQIRSAVNYMIEQSR